MPSKKPFRPLRYGQRVSIMLPNKLAERVDKAAEKGSTS